MANITAARQATPKYYNKYNVNVLAYDTHSRETLSGGGDMIIISKTRNFSGKVSKYEKMEKMKPKNILYFPDSLTMHGHFP